MIKTVRTGFKNRSRVEILYDIVRAPRERPCLKNTILHKANLSNFLLRKHLDYVLSNGLLETRLVDETVMYCLTPRGFKFLESYEYLQDIINSSGVEREFSSSLLVRTSQS